MQMAQFMVPRKYSTEKHLQRVKSYKYFIMHITHYYVKMII